jgi:hypothetical protein
MLRWTTTEKAIADEYPGDGRLQHYSYSLFAEGVEFGHFGLLLLLLLVIVQSMQTIPIVVVASFGATAVAHHLST